MNRYLLPGIATIIMAFFSFCKSAQYANAPNPGERYDPSTDIPLVSTLTIPVNIAINDLVSSLNSMTQGVLYEDYSFTDNGNDNLMLKITKVQPITMFVNGQTLKYRIPVQIWAKQKLFLGSAEVQGDLALNMKTTFSINPDWSLRTQTTVEYHEWLKNPVLKTGLGNINIQSLANIMLNRSKTTLSETLDRMVSQQFTLRPYIQEAWIAIQEPVLLDEEYRAWIKTTPISIGMTPLETDWNTIRAKIAVECHNDVSFGEKPVFRQNSSLPNLKMIHRAPDDFQVRIVTDVPFEEAQRLARTMMVGQVFESGRKKVRIDDIRIWGNGARLVVNAQLSGSFNGNIYFTGRPLFNPQRNQIEVADLDFHTDTRNLLLKSAAWLFSGPIKKRMADAMAFPLDQDLADLKSTIQETLNHYEIQQGVVLTGTVDSIAVEQTMVTPAGIRVDLFSKGKLNVEVKGL
ncbi:MAG: DUF4403 family protein [Bacteroidetes bacterium]|nr:MAG: DUF4403 family protein [Bacteroidota bacterium]